MCGRRMLVLRGVDLDKLDHRGPLDHRGRSITGFDTLFALLNHRAGPAATPATD